MKKLLLGLLSIVFATSLAFALTVAWDPNSEPDLAGYKLYWGPRSGYHTNKIDVGNVTNYTIANTNFIFMKTNYFVVTAYNTSGLESIPSNEIFWVRTNTVAPTKTENLRVLSIDP
jgi:hypothetical protein